MKRQGALPRLHVKDMTPQELALYKQGRLDLTNPPDRTRTCVHCKQIKPNREFLSARWRTCIACDIEPLAGSRPITRRPSRPKPTTVGK
jgi:hypothetical protein